MANFEAEFGYNPDDPLSVIAKDYACMAPAELKMIRQRLGFTQQQAALFVGVTENTWSRWERGEMKIHPARLRDIERLAARSVRANQRPNAGHSPWAED